MFQRCNGVLTFRYINIPKGYYLTCFLPKLTYAYGVLINWNR